MYSAATLLDVLDLDTPLIGFHLSAVAGYVNASHFMDYESSLLLRSIDDDYEASGETYCDDTILDFTTDVDSCDGPEPSLENVIDFYRRYSYMETEVNRDDALELPSGFELPDTFVEYPSSSSGSTTPDTSLPNTPANGTINLPEESHSLGSKLWQIDALGELSGITLLSSNGPNQSEKSTVYRTVLIRTMIRM